MLSSASSHLKNAHLMSTGTHAEITNIGSSGFNCNSCHYFMSDAHLKTTISLAEIKNIYKKAAWLR